MYAMMPPSRDSVSGSIYTNECESVVPTIKITSTSVITVNNMTYYYYYCYTFPFRKFSLPDLLIVPESE